jgi:hypothetical protein
MTVSQIPFLEVVADPITEQGLRTKRLFPKEAEVIDLRRHAELVPAPTTYSIQAGHGQYIDGPYTRYLNHSCEPNIFVNTATMKVITLHPIEVGEELRFFYPATEWNMVSPFICSCGSSRCLGIIRGAKHIAPEILRGYQLNEHIEQLIAGRRRSGGFYGN